MYPHTHRRCTDGHMPAWVLTVVNHGSFHGGYGRRGGRCHAAVVGGVVLRAHGTVHCGRDNRKQMGYDTKGAGRMFDHKVDSGDGNFTAVGGGGAAAEVWHVACCCFSVSSGLGERNMGSRRHKHQAGQSGNGYNYSRSGSSEVYVALL